MRRSEKQMSETAAVEEVLGRAQFCRIAMCDGDRPYLVPVCFGYEPGKLYFHCASEGRKLDVLRVNPRVCFQADVDSEVVVKDKACGCTTNFKSVIGSGAAVILTDLDQKRHGLDVLMRQYTDGAHEYPEKMLAKTAVVRIDIEEMTGKQAPAPSSDA